MLISRPVSVPPLPIGHHVERWLYYVERELGPLIFPAHSDPQKDSMDEIRSSCVAFPSTLSLTWRGYFFSQCSYCPYIWSWWVHTYCICRNQVYNMPLYSNFFGVGGAFSTSGFPKIFQTLRKCSTNWFGYGYLELAWGTCSWRIFDNRTNLGASWKLYFYGCGSLHLHA
jgi:hypothetical protein